MNKKGFLLAEETLKIVLAVISIGFLVYFLSVLYFANQGNEELEQAEASLEYLIEQINLGEETVEIYNPSPDVSSEFFGNWGAWDLMSFSQDENIPDKCSSFNWKNCLCICAQPDNCDDIGVCRESDAIINENSIEIDKIPLSLKINYEDNKITISK